MTVRFRLLISILLLACGLRAATPIPQALKKTVIFIYSSKDGQRLSPVGTGFVVGVPLLQNKERSQLYLVTARHVLEDESGNLRERVWVRFNMRDGGSIAHALALTGETRVSFHPTDKDVDLVVLPIGLNEKKVDFLFLGADILISQRELRQAEITEGADIFFMGLFTHYMGYTRSIPIVRFGKIALLTEEKVPWKEAGRPPQLLNLYLMEALAYGGNSGSPVFLYLGAESTPGVLRVGTPQVKLIGIVKGHYNESAEIAIAQKNDSAVPFAKVNSGILAVIPAYLLYEILYGEELQAQRAAIK